MRAMVIESFGDPSVFKEREIEKPLIRAGHLLLKVNASSVNPIDGRIRRGETPAMAPDFPAVLQGDVAGIVLETGEGVKGFKTGDEVYGFAGGAKGTAGGALAEYMLVDADFMALKPKTIDIREAAALPLVSLAAWQAVIEQGKACKGQKILVHAAAGGVGHVAIQLAKWAGADVYATAHTPEKLALGESLGAVVIDYEKETVRDYVKRCTDKRGFDIVFDTVGGSNLEKSFEAVKPLGHVLAIATRSTHDLTLMNNKGLTLSVVNTMYPLVSGRGRAHYGQIMRQIMSLVDDGALRPVIHPEKFTFSDAAKAHRIMESGKSFGKVALVNEW